MPRSRRWFGYVTDDLVTLAIDQDESNAESPDLGFGPVPASVAERPELRLKSSSKFPIEPRYVLAERVDADGRIEKRKFQVGSTGEGTIWDANVVTLTVGGVLYTVTAKVGEVRHYIAFRDTGLIDGDVDLNTAGLS